MDTYEIIHPIITQTYGKSSYINGMARDIAEKIDEFDVAIGPILPFECYESERTRRLTNWLWNWQSGGSTAARTADKIIVALDEQH
jgi:hypothetical protein